MKKALPRGSHEERTSTHNGIEMACVTWKDNKIVTLLSTYVGATPVFSVTRYDSNSEKTKKVVIPCPQIIHEYNKDMGGGGLNGQFLGRFHIPVRSKKWYLRIFFHLLDLTVIKEEKKRKNDNLRNLITILLTDLR